MAMIEKYGENAYTDGYKVYTTVKRKDQLSAEDAVHTGIIDYDMRHGYQELSRYCGRRTARHGIQSRS